jgi:integrase
VLANFRSFASWCVQRDLIDVNPFLGVKKVRETQARDRILSDDELAAAWLSTDESYYGQFVSMLILTGARRSEIGQVRWDWLDTTGTKLTVPRAHMKAKQTHVVHLNVQAQKSDAIHRTD